MGDIKVQRGTVNVGAAGTTVAPGTNFGSLASTIVWNTNNRRTQGGRTDLNSGNVEADDMSGGIHLASTSSIQFDRIGASVASDCRFDWESWEYQGDPGGSHEFIVRGRFILTMSGHTLSQAVAGVVNKDDCVPIITGIMSPSTSDDADDLTCIAYMTSASNLQLRRGGNGSQNVTVYVTVAEFTGSGWTVKHGREVDNAADSGTVTLVDDSDGVTGGGGDVGDWANTMIVSQYSANLLNGVDDAISDTSVRYEPGANTTSVQFNFDANHVDSGAVGSRQEMCVHTLTNAGLQVTRFNDTQNTAGAMLIGITGAGLTALDEASITVDRTSSGSGTAYGRGWVNARLNSLTQAELWVHRSGNTINSRVQVVNLSGLAVIAVQSINSGQGLLGSELDVLCDGFGFGAVQGTGTLELANNSDYGSATIVVAQSIDSWSDVQIQFDVNRGALLDGTVYAFVTNDNGDRSAAYPLNLGLPTYDTVVTDLAPDHRWDLQGTYDDTGTVGGAPMTTDVVGSATFEATQICEIGTQSWALRSVTDRRGCQDNNEMNVGSPQQERTMGGWVVFNDIQKSMAALYKEGGAVNNLAFLTGFGNRVMAQLADTNDDQAQSYSDISFEPGRPYLVLFRYSYNENPEEFLLIVDRTAQPRSFGNPLLATDLDTHSGDINWGDPDNNLEMGGTDIAFAGQNNTNTCAWFTWTRALSVAEYQQLFDRGAYPDVTITSDTVANMQIQIDALAGTERRNWPLCIRILEPTDTVSPTFDADDLTFNALATWQVEWRGGGTLTWRNGGTSNLQASEVLLSGGGSIVVIETVSVTLTVQDLVDSSPVVGARVRIEADAGGNLPQGALILEGTTDALGQITTQIDYDGVDQPVTGRVRRATAGTLYRTSPVSGTITASGLTQTAFMIRDE